MWKAVNNFENALQQLSSARAMWEQNRPDYYQLDFNTSDKWGSVVCPVRQITYEEDRVVSVNPSYQGTTCSKYFDSLTMESMFNMIEADLYAGPNQYIVMAEYDPVYGYVTYYSQTDMACRRLGWCGARSFRFANLKVLDNVP